MREESSPVDVVAMTEAQEAPAGEMLARAFSADPIFVHVLPDERERVAFLERFMTALARRSRRFSVALVTAGDLAGASLWKGPELRSLSPGQLAESGLDRIGDWLGRAAGERFDAVFDAVDAALERDVPGPCWYLGVLGVAPGRQGRGLGSRLMAPILARADRDRLPVTLETSQERNLPLYRRHGFEVLRELGAAETGGPTVWTMARAPRR